MLARSSSGGFYREHNEGEQDENEREVTVRKVRGIMKLAGSRNSGGKLSASQKVARETENWKQLFLKCDHSGEGTLSFPEFHRLARKHLKIPERVVPDEHLHYFFSALDHDGGGKVDFMAFMDFVNVKPSEAAHNEKIVHLVKRAVKLALTRLRMTLAQLEYRFYHSAEEGILDSNTGDGSLGPEEMRRFFRKVLGLSDHEIPDRHLVIAFKSMDEDDGGTLDAEEFMDFIRGAVSDESGLSPRAVRTCVVPNLISGMRDTLDRERAIKRERDPQLHVPFCLNGREIPPATRFQMSQKVVLYSSSSKMMRSSSSSSGRAGTPQGGGHMGASGPMSLLRSSSSMPALPSVRYPTGKLKEHTYFSIKGADALNRVEQRLYDSGIDVRGGYHRLG